MQLHVSRLLGVAVLPLWLTLDERHNLAVRYFVIIIAFHNKNIRFVIEFIGMVRWDLGVVNQKMISMFELAHTFRQVA